MLREVSRLFREEPDKIGQNRDALMERLARRRRGPPAKSRSARANSTSWRGRSAERSTRPTAGFAARRNSPIPRSTNCVWRAGLRSGDKRFFELIEHTLERICEGGIYDHLGGGFSRYSVDERWLVPHFEKMLYDNAQLLELLALAFARSGNPLFRQRATETVGWLKREMTTPEGAFSALARRRIRKARRASSTSGPRPTLSKLWEPKMLHFLCSITM